MATATAVNPINNVNSIGRCQICGSMRETAPVTFHRNVGMLVLRQTHRLTGNLCKTCIGKKFSEFTIKNLLLGLETRVHRVVVSDLKEDTFYALIWLERDGQVISIDSRPSDALAS